MEFSSEERVERAILLSTVPVSLSMSCAGTNDSTTKFRTSFRVVQRSVASFFVRVVGIL